MLHFKPSNNENQRFTKRWIFEDLTIWWYPLTAFTTTWGYPRLTFLRAMRGSYWASLRTETQRFIRNLGAGWVYWNIILIFFAHRHYNCEVFLFCFFTWIFAKSACVRLTWLTRMWLRYYLHLMQYSFWLLLEKERVILCSEGMDKEFWTRIFIPLFRSWK